MIIRKTQIDAITPLTEEEKTEVEALKNVEPTPDEENPAYSLEELRKMKRDTEERKRDNKQTIMLRISPEAFRKAESLGEGYTSILSHIIENLLNDPEALRRSL